MINSLTWFAEPAHAAIGMSLLFASISLTTVLLLYLRRRSAEHETVHDKMADRILSQELMAHLAVGHCLNEIKSDGLEPQQVERVFSHLLQLVRGPERDLLLTIADTLGVPDPAIAQLRHRNEARRVDAIRLLEQLPVPRVVRLLTASMSTDRSTMVRTEAAAILTRIGSVPSPCAIIDSLNLRTTNPSLLHAAMFRAGSVQYGSEMAALVQKLPKGALRSMIAEALGWSENFSMLSIIADLAQSDDSELRVACLKAARQLGHPGAQAWVLPMLLDPVDAVRVQAVRTCGQLRLVDAIPVLSRLVENSSWWVRTRSAESLAILRAAQPAPFAVTGLRK